MQGINFFNRAENGEALNLRFYRIPVSFKAITVIKKYMAAAIKLAQIVSVNFFSVLTFS